jgi:formate hydrogenlyase subunit 6/NADH:ubiquinone oxidoreductase subunit I
MIKPGKMLREVLRSVGLKPATRLYPAERPIIPERFRGQLRFFADKCIGCKLCMRDCPSNAIVIEKVGEKQFKAHINLDQCLYCGQCVDSCMKKALEMTTVFELAQLARDKLKIEYDAKPPAEAPVKTS